MVGDPLGGGGHGRLRMGKQAEAGNRVERRGAGKGQAEAEEMAAGRGKGRLGMPVAFVWFTYKSW